MWSRGATTEMLWLNNACELLRLVKELVGPLWYIADTWILRTQVFAATIEVVGHTIP